MSFNIFGSPNRCDIRLGYIDPERGYVTGIGIVEANKYASLNPGAQFIFESGDSDWQVEISNPHGNKPLPGSQSYKFLLHKMFWHPPQVNQ